MDFWISDFFGFGIRFVGTVLGTRACQKNNDQPLYFSTRNGSLDMKHKTQRARRRTRKIRRGYFFPGDLIKSAVLAKLDKIVLVI